MLSRWWWDVGRVDVRELWKWFVRVDHELIELIQAKLKKQRFFLFLPQRPSDIRRRITN